MRTWVYIDGFNLYYGAVREAEKNGHGNFRWLDLLALSHVLLPHDKVETLKFFTALIPDRPNDPTQRRRQRTYWDALKTLPGLEIIEGNYRTDQRYYPLWSEHERMLADLNAGISVIGRRLQTVAVYKPEEKGSDVNLAVHLIHDAHNHRFEKALVISNDSDLAEALRIVRDELGLSVVICNPSPRQSVQQLANVATEQRRIRVNVLKRCQLPSPVTDPLTGRLIGRPSGW